MKMFWKLILIIIYQISIIFTLQSTTISSLCDTEGTCDNISSILHSNTSQETDYDDEEIVKNFLNITTSKTNPRAPTLEPPLNVEPKKISIRLNPAGNACPCDLLPSACDINCCCDLNCKDHHLTSFSHCYTYNQATKLYDSRYCYRTDFIKKNTTDFILDRLADNLFCISHDNLPPFYSSITTIEVKNRRHFEEVIKIDEEDKSLAYQWYQSDEQEIEKLKINVPYIHGDLLRKYHRKFVKSIDIPATGFTGQCTGRRSLKYLENFQSFCLQTELDNSNEFLFSENFSDIQLISNSVFIKNVSSGDSECPKNICIGVERIFCEDGTFCNGSNVSKGDCRGGNCSNIVKRVQWIIYHNGTKGIQRAKVYLEIGNVSRSFHQHFQIKYEWIDKINTTEEIERSGNPGYLIGKPIIIGTLVSSNLTKTNIQNEIIINTTKSFLTIPLAGKDGKCLENEKEKLKIEFGVDTKTRCTISLTTDNFSTKFCVKLQEKILDNLFGDSLTNISQIEFYKIHVSKSSNISSNITNWTQILLNKVPKNNANGEILGDKIICNGVIKSLRIDFLYSILPKIDYNEHYKIIGVGITLGDPSHIYWDKCSDDGCRDELEVEIVNYVVFNDISAPSMYYYAGGPNLDISLPYDFFYPFLSGNMYNRAGYTRISGLCFLFIVVASQL